VSKDCIEFLKNFLNSHYNEEIKKSNFEPDQDPNLSFIENFTNKTLKWLNKANKHFDKRDDHKGIWYSGCYIRKHGDNSKKLLNRPLDSISHPEYWDFGIKERFQENSNKKYQMPSEMLDAFFDGPTIAECSSVLQACQFKALEEILGTKTFNNYFKKPITPFLISRIFFNPIFPNVHDSDPLKLPLTKNAICINEGNPIYFLFNKKYDIRDQKKPKFKENDIEPGDIVYISGVDKYNQKHLEGSSIGWHLVCTGKNDSNENLYSGFSLYKFDTPKTYEEMKEIFIEGYNKEHSLDTKEFIRRNPSHPKSLMAQSLAEDQVGNDYPIVGLLGVMRLDPEKVKYFITERQKHQRLPWYHEDPDNKLPQDSNLVNKFIKAVSELENEPLGMVIMNQSKILEVDFCKKTANLLTKAGKKVLFIDSASIELEYQKLINNKETMTMADKILNEMFDKKIIKADIIIFNNFNQKFYCIYQLLRRGLYSVFKNKKSILITSESYFNLKKHIPDYIGYDHPFVNNFLVVNV
jgi:hypothetical protein